MTKFALLLTATASIAAPAAAQTPISFQRDGTTYVASTTEHDGVQHIVGREVGSGRAFDLVISRGRVSGTYDGFQVSYLLPKPDRLASR